MLPITFRGFRGDVVKAWHGQIQHAFLGRDLDIRDTTTWEVAAPDIKLHLLEQCHSTKIANVLSATDFQRLFVDSRSQADAWLIDFTAVPHDHLFGIKSADCIPVLAWIPNTQLRVAAHCGWRGTVGGLLPKLLDALAAKHHRITDLQIAIGPGAGGCCYEVGENVFEPFIEAYRRLDSRRDCTAKADMSSRERSTIDLRDLLRKQAIAAGVSSDRIFVHPLCTICHADQFFSFRREGEHAGRQVSFIGI